MAHRAVLQPNGLYARYSDIVDHFTHFNLTREDLITVYEFMPQFDLEKATGKLDRADAHPERFDEEIETITSVHGPLEGSWTRAYLSGLQPTPSPMLRSRPNRTINDVNGDIAAYKKILTMLNPGHEDNEHFIDQYKKELAKLLKELVTMKEGTNA